MTPPPDFYGVPAQGVVEQVDSITLSHTSPAALSKAGITSYPSAETAQATPTADVITVYDTTTSHPLVLGTDYTLTASGSRPEAVTYSVTRINSSSLSADGDTAHVTYRYGMQPDVNYALGEFQGEPGAAPAGTAFEASGAPTTGSVTAGIGEQGAGGSLTDPAAGRTGSETGSPGSEYTVTETEPGALGWPAGSPDTNPAYGGGQPGSFVPQDTSYSGTLDTTASGGSNLVPGMYASPPGYRSPTSGVAASVKDTSLTDILGNALNASPLPTDSSYAALDVDTSYIGAPAAPTSLLAQADTFTADQAGQPDYLSQQGVIASTIVVTDTSTSATLVLGTDYTVTTAGNGANTVAYVTPQTGSGFTAGNNLSVAYSYGDPTYWDSNVPASVPGAPAVSSATAVNRGAQVAWSAPSGTTPVDYYLLECEDRGTMYVPVTGQPVDYGQPAPSGGAQAGQPAYQADSLTLLSAALAAPVAPTATGNTGSGSTLAAGNYKVAVTYVNSNGETTASSSATVAVTAGDNLVITSPGAEAGATGWYAYVSQAGGSTLTRQQAAGSPTAIGTALTLTAPPTSAGASPPALNTTLATLSRQGVLTPPNALIVRDVTSAAQSILTSGEVAGGEGDPFQADGQVLEYGYDYTVTVTGIGPWAQYQVALAAGSVNAAAGDHLVIEYWWGADPSAVSAVFTQGVLPNTPVIYKPDGSTPYTQGYRFRVAAGNRAGLGPYSAYSAYVVPLNYNEPQPGHEGSITVGTGSLDPANAINPIYAPDGTVKAGTGLGG